MIEFFKFPSAFGMRDASPFVLKLETYLRLAGIEYKTTEEADPRKAPKAKMPFIKDGDKIIGDSSIIISYLKDKYGDSLGKGLTPEQHAIGHAVKTMLEERTYWVLVNDRWMNPKNQLLIRDTWFGAIPKFIRGVIFGKIVKDMKRAWRGTASANIATRRFLNLGFKTLKRLKMRLGVNHICSATTRPNMTLVHTACWPTLWLSRFRL